MLSWVLSTDLKRATDGFRTLPVRPVKPTSCLLTVARLNAYGIEEIALHPLHLLTALANRFIGARFTGHWWCYIMGDKWTSFSRRSRRKIAPHTYHADTPSHKCPCARFRSKISGHCMSLRDFETNHGSSVLSFEWSIDEWITSG